MPSFADVLAISGALLIVALPLAIIVTVIRRRQRARDARAELERRRALAAADCGLSNLRETQSFPVDPYAPPARTTPPRTTPPDIHHRL